MIKTLVSIEVDLAASRAIRFACQLGNFMEMEIHPVYIKEAPPREMSMGRAGPAIIGNRSSSSRARRKFPN